MSAEHEYTTTLGSLARPSGLAQLRAYLESSDKPLSLEDAAALRAFLRREIATADPDVSATKLRIGRTGYGGGAYFPKSNLISVEKPANLPVLGHEIGHARRLSDSTAYRALVDISSRLQAITQLTAAPAALATAGLVENVAKRNKIIGAIAAVSALSSLPRLYEEIQATRDALRYVPDRTEAIKRLAPGLVSYTVSAALAPTAALLINAAANKVKL